MVLGEHAGKGKKKPAHYCDGEWCSEKLEGESKESVIEGQFYRCSKARAGLKTKCDYNLCQSCATKMRDYFDIAVMSTDTFRL